jgi:hypothetical protein
MNDLKRGIVIDANLDPLIGSETGKIRQGECRPMSFPLKRSETIWAAAGTPFALFRLKPADLDALTGGRRLDLAERPEPGGS